jgi:hypothetical protein
MIALPPLGDLELIAGHLASATSSITRPGETSPTLPESVHRPGTPVVGPPARELDGVVALGNLSSHMSGQDLAGREKLERPLLWIGPAWF